MRSVSHRELSSTRSTKHPSTTRANMLPGGPRSRVDRTLSSASSIRAVQTVAISIAAEHFPRTENHSPIQAFFHERPVSGIWRQSIFPVSLLEVTPRCYPRLETPTTLVGAVCL